MIFHLSRKGIATAVALAMLLTGSWAAAVEKSGEVRIAGSSTIKPVVMVAARIVGKKYNVAFSVSGGSSADGVREVIDRQAEMGMASRYFNPDEVIKSPDLRYFTIGFDGIALIVNRNNPAQSLTRQQVQDIFTGGIRNWNQAGGPNLAIELVAMDPESSSTRLFTQYFGLRLEREGQEYRFRRAEGASASAESSAHVAYQNSQAIVRVGERPGAIGFLSMGAAQRAEVKLGTIKKISLDGVEASRDNIRNKTYPIVMPLNLVTLGAPDGHMKVFIDYLLSGYGQNIVKNLDYTPIR